MKKGIIYLSIFFSASLVTLCNAQNWSPVGGGVEDNGYFPYISALGVYNGGLYAGGIFDSAGGHPANGVAMWNGTSWSAVGVGISTTTYNGYYISCFAVYNGELYVGGTFDTAGGIAASNIAMWNGSTWAAVGTGIKGLYSGVSSLGVYNGKLYAGGEFTIAGGNAAKNIASWDGTTWSAVGSGMNSGVASLVTYDSVLYAAGNFDTAGGIPSMGIAQWNGTAWSPLSSGINGVPSCLAVYKYSLYAAGRVLDIGSAPTCNIVRWNGTVWDSVASSNPANSEGPIFAMQVANGDLYVGGFVSRMNGIITHKVASYNGTVWDSVGSGFGDTVVNALALYDGQVYAAGQFYNSGSTTAICIARWDHPLGIKPIVDNSNSIMVYPNPSTGIVNCELLMVNENTQVQVYNVLGEKVYSQFNIHNSQFTIDLSSNPNGIYLYRVVSNNGKLIGDGKLIIQK